MGDRWLMYTMGTWELEWLWAGPDLHNMQITSIVVTPQGKIAKSITLEQGKTLIDAEGDVMRGLRKYCSCRRQEEMP